MKNFFHVEIENGINGDSEEKEEEGKIKTDGKLKFNIEKMIITILKKQKDKSLSRKLIRKKVIEYHLEVKIINKFEIITDYS